VKQAMGLLKPTNGSIQLGDHDLVGRPCAALQLCCYLPQQAVEIAGLIRAPSGEARQRTDRLMSALDMEEWADTITDLVCRTASP
jgi:ABC-type multidrug transport system ATPase subunit